MPKIKYTLIEEPYENLNLPNHINIFAKIGFCVSIFFLLVLYRNWGYVYLNNKIYTETISNGTAYKSDMQNMYKEPLRDNNSKYFVKTIHCLMPSIDPFSAEAKKIFQPLEYKNCTNDEPLVSVLYDINKEKYLLHMKTERFLSLYKNENNSEAENKLSCCYRQIVRSGSGNRADDSFQLLPCANFHPNFVVPEHIEFIIVECSKNFTIIQKDAFSFIQYKNKTKSTSSKARRKPSVFLIGIDSLSRMNFRRTMPQTHKYLEENNWFEMQGYNKVGENTFPNLIALLNGGNETMAFRDCNPTTVGGLDKCYFIWQDYRKFGYRTAYAEDMAMISTFNFIKKGFNMQPTDYYLRPMMLAIEKNLNATYTGFYYCIERKHYGTYIYDYALQLANRYKAEPTFGLFWTNSFSHNHFLLPSTMDVKMLEYFKTFKSNGILENTIVIFLSDHGGRFGEIRKMSDFFFEERLPLFYIYLPKWFRNYYPDFVKALKINTNRLTSTYDIHMTLKHILELGEPSLSLPGAKSCVKCQSIFLQVPENRSCSDVGIPEHYCTCIPYKNQSIDDEIVKYITKQIIVEMNSYLNTKKLIEVCCELELEEIKTAQLKVEDDIELLHNPIYRIQFIVNPKHANYEATVIYSSLNKTIQVNVEDISCLTSYKNVSQCVNDKQAKKYCICK